MDPRPTIRLHNGRTLRRHATIRGGRFKLVLSSRQLTHTRTIVARFAGSPAFTPARAILRLGS